MKAVEVAVQKGHFKEGCVLINKQLLTRWPYMEILCWDIKAIWSALWSIREETHLGAKIIWMAPFVSLFRMNS